MKEKVNPMAQFFPELDGVLKSSELLTAVARVKAAKRTGKPVSKELAKQLEQNGCWSSDWSKVYAPADLNAKHLFAVKFFGECSIGKFDADPVEVDKGLKMSAGIYNSVVIDSEIGDNAVIYNVGVLSNTVVGASAAVINTQSVTCTGGTSYGNGVEIGIAIETGGREIRTYAELTVDVAERVTKNRANVELLAEYAAFIEKYVAAAKSDKTIIEEGARVRNAGKIVNAFIGPYAVVDNAGKISDVTILSNKDEKTEVLDGSWVAKSILQWGSEVASMGLVDQSVLTEHSHVERHGKVTQSILGPNTGVAEGEVTASLVGPFVGFHHQSLLIATMWPEGKGNVGYGANVGSNHTAKAPDQELWPGEGTFFGLGANIKFPSDFTKAPYTIIATAVTALPQRVEFPFSLIIQPDQLHDGVSPAYNEIIPGWVLSENIYAVRRNEGKYQKRNKARRSTFQFEVFRPDIVDLMLEARGRLRSVMDDRLLAQRLVKSIYTDKDIKGIGKNFLREDGRKRAIDIYTFYIHYYALCGLKRQVEKVLAMKSNADVTEIVNQATDDARWEHERKILVTEFAGKEVTEMLHDLIRIQERIAKDVQVSKEKDDNRGLRIISDYKTAHPAAINDPFVKETWELTRKAKHDIQATLAKIYAAGS